MMFGIELQIGTGAGPYPDNPYIAMLMVGVIISIIIIALGEYRKDRRAKIQSSKKSC